MAAITAPDRTAAQHQSLLHFVGQGDWSRDQPGVGQGPRRGAAGDRTWNAALEAKQKIENDIAALLAERPAPLGGEEQEALRRLGGDIPDRLGAAATASMKKRILRAVIHEIIVRKDDGGIGFVMRLAGRRAHCSPIEGPHY